MFAEMPLDNRTVNELAALPPHQGFLKPVSNIAKIETT